ncbi:hypothetical protein HN51_051550 [Arachis hypogaea]
MFFSILLHWLRSWNSIINWVGRAVMQKLNEEFKSICLRTKVRATLDAVEEVIEERDLDPLFSNRYTLFWIMLLLSKLVFSYYVEEMSRLTFNVKLDAVDAI